MRHTCGNTCREINWDWRGGGGGLVECEVCRRCEILAAVVSLFRMQKQFHMYFLTNPGGTVIIVYKRDRPKHKQTTAGVQSVVTLPAPWLVLDQQSYWLIIAFPFKGQANLFRDSERHQFIKVGSIWQQFHTSKNFPKYKRMIRLNINSVGVYSWEITFWKRSG